MKVGTLQQYPGSGNRNRESYSPRTSQQSTYTDYSSNNWFFNFLWGASDKGNNRTADASSTFDLSPSNSINGNLDRSSRPVIDDLNRAIGEKDGENIVNATRERKDTIPDPSLHRSSHGPSTPTAGRSFSDESVQRPSSTAPRTSSLDRADIQTYGTRPRQQSDTGDRLSSAGLALMVKRIERGTFDTSLYSLKEVGQERGGVGAGYRNSDNDDQTGHNALNRSSTLNRKSALNPGDPDDERYASMIDLESRLSRLVVSGMVSRTDRKNAMKIIRALQNGNKSKPER